jgi:SulP family sulfate permease
VLLATFLLTIFRDLTEGILVGFGLGTLLFLNRMAQATTVDSHAPLVPEDRADDANGGRLPYDATLASDRDLLVYRISGAFFFGAASSIGAILDRIADRPKTFILDFAAVPLLDSTAANTIDGLARKLERRGAELILTGAAPSVRKVLHSHGLRAPRVQYQPNVEAALGSRQAVSSGVQPAAP